jgi:alpha-aminoadipic semialdehyde synthase
MSMWTIGIRKEDELKRMERRTPLTPEDVRRLLLESPELEVWVERSEGKGYKYERVFRDHEYEAAGAKLVDSLDGCPVILGIKEPQIEQLRPGTVYACFSHTFKAQSRNLPLLKRLKRLGCTLVDYEMLVHEVPDDLYYTPRAVNAAPAAFQKRTVYFGKFAGISGIVDSLWALGQRWHLEGYTDNPFVNLHKAIDYRHDGEDWGSFALAEAAIIQAGNVLARDGLRAAYAPLIIGVAGRGHAAQGTMEVLDLLPIQHISAESLLNGFAPPPEEAQRTVYVVSFGRDDTKQGLAPYLDHLTMVINCITWKGDAPRLVTRADMARLYGMQKAGRRTQEAEAAGYLALDDGNTVAVAELERVAPKLKVIGDVSCDPGGAIEFSNQTFPDAPVYTYIPALDDDWSLEWDDGPQQEKLFAKSCRMGFEERGPGVMAVTNLPCEFPKDASEVFSGMLMPYVMGIAELGRRTQDAGRKNGPLLTEEKENSITTAPTWTQSEIPTTLPVRRATMVYQGQLTPDYHYLEEKLTKEVLVLGAGQVSPALLRHLKACGYNITITDVNPAAAEARVAVLGTGKVVPLQIHADTSPEALLGAFRKADCVVSILPPPLHPVAARAAIHARVPLVTASYVSPEMAALDAEAKAAGIPILNEMGLDPGIDHMSAVEMLRAIHAEGGEIEAFSSYCGGLPAPSAADNPLRYKFSWSPAGVVNATTNPATYLENGETITVPAEALFANPKPLTVAGWDEPFETYPNRNSMPYIERYGIPEAQSFIRGTIRYAGWGALFNALRDMGWLSQSGIPSFDAPADLQDAIEWIVAGQELREGESPIQALTRFLMAKPELQYQPGEQDMVVMQHKVIARFPDGRRETRTATLTLYGEPATTSAMSLTTGGTIGIGAEAILEGVVSGAGVLIPLDPALCHFALERLEGWGVTFVEDKA